MLRNLLYSFFFHIIFIALLFISTIDFSKKIIKSKITPLTISFLSENILDNLKQIKNKKTDERVKELNIDEKIELYNKVKNLKKTESNKVIYEKSEKKKIKTKSKSKINDDKNEFTYYYTPVYVAEDRVNTKQKRRLLENRLKRQELRKKIKERNIIPKIDLSDMKKMKKMQEVIEISQRPLIVKRNTKKEEKKIEENKKNIKPLVIAEKKEEIKEKEDKKVEKDITKETENIDELIEEINFNQNRIADKYKNISENEIFTAEDYDKLKEIEESKEDGKFKLSLREKRNIQTQIKGCYKMAILRSKKDSKAIVGLTVRVEKNGIIDMTSVRVNKIADNFDEDGFNIALENAKSALVFCSPLRGLPFGKYNSWKQMTFVFDSNNLE